MADTNKNICNKALIVDADHKVCETLAQTLKGAGYEPEIHLEPHKSLSELSRNGYTLAFIEVDLPEVNGVELGKALKEADAPLELVFMGRNGSFEQAVSALKLGAYDYIEKPFDPGELRMLLKRLRERSGMQQSIAETRRRHQHLIQSIPLLVFSLNRDFQLEFINDACAQILGYSPQVAMAEPGWLLERIHPLDAEQLREALLNSFSHGAPFSIECRMIHSKGSEIHGIIRSMPGRISPDGAEVCGNDEELDVVEGVFIDITDRIFLEKALVQNEKLKTLGAISSEMAHEVRNPLMSIAGFAKRLQKKHPDMPEVGIILRESLRLERLLNRIREYLEPVEGHSVECSLNSVLAECLSLLYQQMNEQGIWCKLEQLEDAPKVMADPEHLSQVFLNLIRNALKSLGPDTAFQITSRENMDSVLVDFRIPNKNGSEVNPEQMFMPFDEGGRSYGLPLCYRLVKDMGGMLLYNRDSGSDVFTVSLPRCKEPDCSPRALGTSTPPDKGRHIFDESNGLLPRHRFEDLFERTCRTASRNGQQLSLLVVDIDHFEEYAQSHDDAQALQCVQTLAKALDDQLSNPFWLLSQYGAQEFIALLPDCSAQEAATLAEKLRSTVLSMGLPFHRGTDATKDDVVTVSVGVNTFTPAKGFVSEETLAQASKALFLARQDASNTVYAIG